MFLVSYYTPNYEQQARNLIKSLEDLNIPNEVRPIDNIGGWDLNTKFKPHFILEHLHNHPYVVWTDADSIVRSTPILFNELNCDVAFHRFKERELLSGTVYFRNTENTFKLLNQWIEENNKYPQEWDQRNLDLALTKIRGLQIGELPPEYCFIYDLSKIEYRNIVPVIEHFQASRTLK